MIKLQLYCYIVEKCEKAIETELSVASGLDWLDSITPLIDLYENGSRTEAFSGIVLYENE